MNPAVAQPEAGRPTHVHLVAVHVDHEVKHVRAGDWIVAAFKTEVGVDPALVLDQITPHGFTELDDAQHITIKGGEKFLSHARTGGSS